MSVLENPERVAPASRRSPEHVSRVASVPLAILLVAGLFIACGGEPNRSTEDESGTAGVSSAGEGSGEQKSSASSDDPSDSETGADTAADSTPQETDDIDDTTFKFDLQIPDTPTNGIDDECPCEGDADLIYVLGEDKSIWTYDPTANTFAARGTLDCEPGSASSTFSMGVTRTGDAWVQMMESHKIYSVDLSNKNACSPTKFAPDEKTFGQSGMAFVSRGEDQSCDDLHLMAFTAETSTEKKGGGRLGRLDAETGKVALVGPTNYTGGELTGTADGRVYAFAGESPARLIQLDRNTAEELETIKLEGLELTSAYAFAFWGGDFYFFTESLTSIPFASKVTRLNYDGDKKLEVVNEKAPLRVVGAGVSTCVPLFPPK